MLFKVQTEFKLYNERNRHLLNKVPKLLCLKIYLLISPRKQNFEHHFRKSMVAIMN